MDFDLTDEQLMLREAARRFAREHNAFEERRRVLASVDGFSRSAWSAYADMGWLALGLPEDVGGLNCSFVETTLLVEEFGRVLALEPYVSSAILCARIVDRSGSERHRAMLLPALAEGKVLLALAHNEGSSREEYARIGTSAVAVGNNFVIDGRKMLVFDAPAADYFIVSARIGADFSLFLVPRSSGGLRVDGYRLIDGTSAADLTLQGVQVPAGGLLAEPARAHEVLDEALDRAVLAQIAEALGAMETVLEITTNYLKQRIQFGQPIGKFQALQHRMSEMFVEVQETRSMLFRGLAYLEESPAARASAISAAKIVATNAARFVGTQGIQLHGGIGMTEEYAVGHFYKKLTVFEKQYGDSEFHLKRFLLRERD